MSGGRVRIGKSGTRDKFILHVRPGLYLSVRVANLRLRIALGRPYKPTFTWIRSRHEPREGLAMVFDDAGLYLGCIGTQTWRDLLAAGNAVEKEPS